MRLFILISVLLTAMTFATDSPAQENLLGKDSVKNYMLIGQTYSGCGNACGLGTDMRIEFERNGVCYCTSDWYKNYAQPVRIKGSYKIEDTIDGTVVNVSCNNFNFEFKKNGEHLFFDNSSEGMGSINNDFMTLNRISK